MSEEENWSELRKKVIYAEDIDEEIEAWEEIDKKLKKSKMDQLSVVLFMAGLALILFACFSDVFEYPRDLFTFFVFVTSIGVVVIINGARLVIEFMKRADKIG